jgi:electron transfer flavoprotein alpha subunit
VILVVGEHREGRLNRAALEAVTAARLLSGGAPVTAALIGDAEVAVEDLARSSGLSEVFTVADPALVRYTSDGFALALADVIRTLAPRHVVFPHTYQTRDVAPVVAARLGRTLLTDVIGITGSGDGATFTRPMFQGKLVAEVRPLGGPPWLVSCQIGAFRADATDGGAARAKVTPLAVTIDAAAIRQRPEAPFQEAEQAVDLSQADRIVAVGRGIKSEDHLALARSLAAAMGAELAASRPICDNGWMPMDRQVGSSGQTVAPRLYVAVGISGAIQHLVGMKGSRTIVAINKDPDAPIFEVADYGIVGDLFEVLPAIVAALERG